MMGNERLNQWIERNEKWKKYIAQGISRPTAVGHRPHSGPTRRTTPPKSPVARPRGPPRRVICIQYRTSRTHSADIFHPVCRTGFTAPIRTTTRGRRTTQISTSRTHNTTLPARPRLSHYYLIHARIHLVKNLKTSISVAACGSARDGGNEHVSNIKTSTPTSQTVRRARTTPIPPAANWRDPQINYRLRLRLRLRLLCRRRRRRRYQSVAP